VTQYLLEVRQSNSAAIALYASLGFQQVGLLKGYYKTETGLEAAILMSKQVP
jgi:ribosomal-protein-alanine N-acetyltransferase